MQEAELLSIIITTYNHAQYLSIAIDSILEQEYPNKEIIVVDDGSTDNTKGIVDSYKQIKYVFQKNAGLSAARNTGINASSGEYLVFLDADDWFLKKAFTSGIEALQQDARIAFSYGSHIKVNEKNEIFPAGEEQDVADFHYLHLLHYNFIAMHAAVIYRRWVFDKYRFDTSLKSCEDYDIYLKITRDHPVVYHSHAMAAYRKHSQNMSGNIPVMIATGLQVMRRQIPLLRSPEEKAWSVKGIKFWKRYYGNELYKQLLQKPFLNFSRKKLIELSTLFRYNNALFIKYFFRKLL